MADGPERAKPPRDHGTAARREQPPFQEAPGEPEAEAERAAFLEHAGRPPLERRGEEDAAGADVASARAPLAARHAELLNAPRYVARSAAPQRARLLEQLQNGYGNSHVARVIAAMEQQGSTGTGHTQGATFPAAELAVQRAAACPPTEALAPPVEAGQDPKFQALQGKVKKVAQQEKKHEPGKAKAAQAQAAAVPPANDTRSQASAAQVGKMAEQKPGTFDKAAFVAAVRKAIDAATPRNMEETAEYKGSGKAERVKGQVSGMVSQSKQTSEKDIKQATQAPPDASKAKPKEVKPLGKEEAGPAPARTGGEGAAPPPKPAAELSLQAGKCEVDGMMKEEQVTDEQLSKSNEPEFKGAAKAKEEAAQHADQAPQAVRQQEQGILEQTKNEAGAETQQGANAMHSKRTGALSAVAAGKTGTKAKDEAKRAEIAAKIEAIYNKAKTEVTAILDGLDGKVNKAFEDGEKAARASFENYIDAKMRDFKKRRYSGWRGKLRWGWDKLTSPPAEVNRFIDEGRKLYLAQMDGVISRVADIVGGALNSAKARIAGGRKEIADYVASLPKNLKKFGQEAQQKFESQFDELDQNVDSKQEDMVQSLKDKYIAARTAIDARVEAMKEANKGLLERAKDAIKGVIETIRKLKNMLLGVLARAAGVIGKIITDPIGFLGNLVSAVKMGLNQFVSNIAKHLLDGLMGWLFGELASSGLQFPQTLDLKGILSLVLQLLGLTYQNIRARAVKLVGEQVVSRVEKTVEFFKILVTEGPAGLWKFIQDKIGDLKETVLGGIMSFVKEKVIIAGVTWLIGLLNPAAAFIKAAKAIYDIIMFFVQRGSQIMEFVNSILDSIGAIASGALGAAASLVEKSLAKILPLAISFLASLLGVGGIGEKIKKIIQSVQKPINTAIDKVVGGVVKGLKKAVGFVKGLFGGKKKGNEAAAGPDPRSDDEKKKAVRQAVGEAHQLLAAKDASAEGIRAKLPSIQSTYGLTSLTLVGEDEGKYHVEGKINPEDKSESVVLGPSKEEIKEAVAAAVANRAKAISEWNSFTSKAKRKKTVSFAGGRSFISGWKGDEQKLATHTRLFDESKRREKKQSIMEQLEVFEKTDKPPTGEGLGLDYGPTPGYATDQGVPGQYVASHAEKQASELVGNQPIGVSRDMCNDCQAYFKTLAERSKHFQVVADPSVVRVFLPDGKVETH